MKKLLVSSIIALLLLLIHGAVYADSELYFDIKRISDYDSSLENNTSKKLITYLPKGNTITKTGDTMYFGRTANTSDCFVELIMADKIVRENNIVMDFVFEPIKIDVQIRAMRTNGSTVNEYYDFISIHPASDAPARVKIMGRGGYINLPEGETRISVCLDVSAKMVDVYIGDTVIEDVPVAISDNFNIRTFWMGTNSSGTSTEFNVRDMRIYSGTEPCDTSDFYYVRNSVMDTNDGEVRAKRLLGSSMVFSEDVFYYNKAKLDPAEAFGSVPYMQDGVLMIPREASKLYLGETVNSVKDKIIFSFGTAYSGDAFYTKADGTEVELSSPIVIKGSNIFVPLIDMCKALGYNYYADERGFVIVNKDTALSFANSAASYFNSETSDVIYRYLHFDRLSGEEIIDVIASRNITDPTLLVTSQRLAKVKENIKSDSVSAQLYAYTLKEADALLDLDPVEYKYQDSLRILDSCQSVKSRLKILSAAYLVSDEANRDKYAAKMWKELESCLNWPNWNTSKHFLDSGMLAQGVGVAYDTLRNYLTDEQKAWVRDRVYTQYLEFCIKAYQGSYTGSEFRNSNSNWGAVCSAGILSVCFAISPDVEGQYRKDVEYLLENSLHSIEFIETVLYPDGAWYEGVGYGGYVGEGITSYCVAPLLNFVGDDLGFMDVPGYTGLYDFSLNVFGPAGIFNYADNAWSGRPYYNSFAYQAALLSESTELMSAQRNHRKIYGGGEGALDVLWYEPDLCTDNICLSRDAYYKGGGKGVMRSSFDAKAASFVGMSAGVLSEYGSHFDKGSFIYDYNGVRWAMDLGFDNYNITGGYHGEPGYTLYRKRTEGHNCVVINPTSSSPGQVSNAYAYMESSASSEGSAYMIYNLTDAYSDNVSSYKRGFYLGDGRETLLIRDEISLLDTSDIYWFMHTESEIVIDSDGKGATLYRDGRELRVTVDCSLEDWHLEVREAQPFDESMIREGEYSREGITKLTLTGVASGDVTITVKLAPRGITTFSTAPLSRWQCEESFTIAPIRDMVWSKNSIRLVTDSTSPYSEAYVATYSADSLKSVDIIDIGAVSEYSLSRDIHTKIFFWDGLRPAYRYYEFNTER